MSSIDTLLSANIQKEGFEGVGTSFDNIKAQANVHGKCRVQDRVRQPPSLRSGGAESCQGSCTSTRSTGRWPLAGHESLVRAKGSAGVSLQKSASPPRKQTDTDLKLDILIGIVSEIKGRHQRHEERHGGPCRLGLGQIGYGPSPLDLRCQAEAEALRRSLENPLTLVQGE